MGMAGFAIRLQQQYAAARQQLQRFVAAPAGSSVIARKLTREQARDLVVHYWVNQVISMERWPECDGNGNVTWPKPTDKVRLQLTIAGVKFTPTNPQAAGWTQTRELDLRNVVLVVRFTQYLKDNWGASVIYWGGLGIGGGRNSGPDTHTEGLAMDFHGAVTSIGHIDVQRDWGNQRVPAAIGGDKYGKWPGAATKTRYRLAVDPLDLGKVALATASPTGFFDDIYQYLTTQARHDSPEAKPRIGEGSGILHPDTPWNWLRTGHQNHFHFEVAKVK
jgi:hypothetical protein